MSSRPRRGAAAAAIARMSEHVEHSSGSDFEDSDSESDAPVTPKSVKGKGKGKGTETAKGKGKGKGKKKKSVSSEAERGETVDGIAFREGTLSRAYEERAAKSGSTLPVGVDEAGRGPLCGPVVAAACYVPPSVDIRGIHDSKKLDETQREALYEKLTTTAGVEYAVGIVDHSKIDEINILWAAMLAMEKAVAGLPRAPDYVFVDGPRVPNQLQEDYGGTAEAVVKGDSKCYSIAAASVIAKVTRDRLMKKMDIDTDMKYNLSQHNGYPTPAHKAAIREHGPSRFHRRTFRPLKDWLEDKSWPFYDPADTADSEAETPPKPSKTKTKRGAKAAKPTKQSPSKRKAITPTPNKTKAAPKKAVRKAKGKAAPVKTKTPTRKAQAAPTKRRRT